MDTEKFVNAIGVISIVGMVVSFVGFWVGLYMLLTPVAKYIDCKAQPNSQNCVLVAVPEGDVE